MVELKQLTYMMWVVGDRWGHICPKEHHHLSPEYYEILLLHGSNLVAIGDPYLTHIVVGIIGLKQANMNILFRPNFW